MQPEHVASHSFCPLIHYLKQEKRYKSSGKAKKPIIVTKDRPIKYASHRDACILTYYAEILAEKLEARYEAYGLSENVIAYRSLGKANYNFAAESMAFAQLHSPVVILAFDVSGFFDNLDHKLLKSRIKQLLEVSELSSDWYKIYRYVTKYRFVALEQLKAHPVFGARLKKRDQRVIASVSELKSEKIPFHPNPTPGKGIPQGTPISAVLSNLYMLDFDKAANDYCSKLEALYRRYSDDILVICRPEDAPSIETQIVDLMKAEKLDLNPDKIERTEFDLSKAKLPTGQGAQYLGFNLSENGATIRQSSISRQFRKMRRAFKRTREVAKVEIAAGRANKVWTKKLRRRFTGLQFRNFSSYGRRSAVVFGKDEKIVKQIRRFERAVERELQKLSEL